MANQEVPLSGGDNITNVVDAQWGISAITQASNVSVTMPSPVFGVSMSITGLSIVVGTGATIKLTAKSNRIKV